MDFAILRAWILVAFAILMTASAFLVVVLCRAARNGDGMWDSAQEDLLHRGDLSYYHDKGDDSHGPTA